MFALCAALLFGAWPAFALDGGEGREPCASVNPLRNAYFGDLHVHTTFSQDASTQGTRNTPRDAYRFARGEPLGIQPYDATGRPLRSLKLDRPLDFAAITDHAELLGETEICRDPKLPGHDSWICAIYRRWPRIAFFLMNWRTSGPRERFAFCGPDGRFCLEAALSPWREIQAAAEGAYDRSAACRFTSFVGYEWTAARDLYNLHRNVIFRSAAVPELPVSFYEAEHAWQLWQALDESCRHAGSGCDYLVIPHNSNLSGGLMFESSGPGGGPRSAGEAREQASNEPLVEVMQHKGDSECLYDPAGSADELCAFEKLPWDGFTGKFVSWLAKPPHPRSFVRDALEQGLLEQQRVGANPFQFGLLASTDTHLGTPGAVAEGDFKGHGGAGKPAREAVPVGLPDDLEFNPGGLAVLWAEENSRGSLFAAMRRREAYGTSGPRITARFFAGWQLPADLCERNDFVEQGYAAGVPMGAVLPQRPEAVSAPRFAVWALRDPGSPERPGGLLQRIQIVKGWVEQGQTRERIYEVVGDPNNGAGVDLLSCTPIGVGSDDLCGVWQDPDFEAEHPAFYYARVIENPSCRWSARVCLAKGVDCNRPETIADGLAPCCSEGHRPIIQERAWTSPIWYEPTERSR
ncbi:MAG: DUF3604 domain-containing protein [Myxococcota bacterium]